MARRQRIRSPSVPLIPLAMTLARLITGSGAVYTSGSMSNVLLGGGITTYPGVRSELNAQFLPSVVTLHPMRCLRYQLTSLGLVVLKLWRIRSLTSTPYWAATDSQRSPVLTGC